MGVAGDWLAQKHKPRVHRFSFRASGRFIAKVDCRQFASLGVICCDCFENFQALRNFLDCFWSFFKKTFQHKLH